MLSRLLIEICLPDVSLKQVFTIFRSGSTNGLKCTSKLLLTEGCTYMKVVFLYWSVLVMLGGALLPLFCMFLDFYCYEVKSGMVVYCLA